MSEPLDFQQPPAAEKPAPEAHGFSDGPQEELGLSASVGFEMNEEETKPGTPPASPASPPTAELKKPNQLPPEPASPAVPSGSDLGLSESVGFIQPAFRKPSAAAAKPPAPPRPHPTHRLEQAWAKMAPVEVTPKAESKTEPAKAARLPKEPAVPLLKTEARRPEQVSSPVSASVKKLVEPGPRPAVQAARQAAAASPIQPSVSRRAEATPPEQIEFLQNQIRQLRLWAYGATVLSGILLVLLWVTRPPGAAHPQAENPLETNSRQ